MKDIILFSLAVAVLALYVVALVQHATGRAFRICTTLDVNALVRDVKGRCVRTPKPLPTPKPTQKHETETEKQDHSEWEQVRYYERTLDGRFSPIEKISK